MSTLLKLNTIASTLTFIDHILAQKQNFHHAHNVVKTDDDEGESSKSFNSNNNIVDQNKIQQAEPNARLKHLNDEKAVSSAVQVVGEVASESKEELYRVELVDDAKYASMLESDSTTNIL